MLMPKINKLISTVLLIAMIITSLGMSTIVSAAEADEVVTSSLADGATGVQAGTDVTLIFTDAMDTSTFSDIKVVDASDVKVAILDIEAPNDRTAVVTLPNTLASKAEYKLVIPTTVKSADNTSLTEEIVINFTSAEVNYITYTHSNGTTYDFNQDFTIENSTAMTQFSNNADAGWRGFRRGRVTDGWTGNITYDADKNAWKIPSILNIAEGYPAMLVYGICNTSGMNLSATGNMVLETEMAFDNVGSGVHYLPMTIVPDTGTLNDRYKFASNMIKISGGKAYIANQDTAITIEADKFYKFRITMNIDGDSATADDPFYAEILDGNEVLASGSGTLSSNGALSSFASGLKAATSVKGVNIVTMQNSTATPAAAYAKYAKGYYVEVPEFTSTLEDGAENVKSGTEVTLSFTRPMIEETLADIKVVDSSDVKAAVLDVKLSSDAKTAVITLPNTLASKAAYKLVVPTTVKSIDNAFLAKETVINFTSAEVNYITYTNGSGTYSFNQDLTVENSSAVSAIAGRIDAGWRGFRDGRYGTPDKWTPDVSYNATKKAWKIPSNKNITNGYPSALLYGYSKSSGVEYFFENVSGNIALETEMAFDNVESGTNYLPIAIVPDTGLANDAYNFASNMIRISGGKAYIANQDTAITIEADKFYKFRITMNIDGDSATADDPFYAEILDGNEVLASGSGTLSSPGAMSSFAENLKAATSIKAINVVSMQNSTDNSAAAYVKYVKGYYAPEIKVDITVPEEIGVADAIVVSFSEEMKAEAFMGIKVKAGNEDAVAIITPVSGVSRTCTITPNNGKWNYGTTYTVSLPLLTSASNIIVKAQDFTVITDEEPDGPVSAKISRNEIKAGEKLEAIVTFKNETDVEQEACLFVALYSADGKLHNVVMQKDVTLGTEVTNKSTAVTLEFTVPADIGDGAYVQAMAWNGLTDMTPLMKAKTK